MNSFELDPLIEGYLSYLDKVGRKSPRTIVDAAAHRQGRNEHRRLHGTRHQEPRRSSEAQAGRQGSRQLLRGRKVVATPLRSIHASRDGAHSLPGFACKLQAEAVDGFFVCRFACFFEDDTRRPADAGVGRQLPSMRRMRRAAPDPYC